MTRSCIALLAISALFVPAMLFADGPGLVRQLMVGLLTAAILWIVVLRTDIDPRQILIVIAIATTGEVVLSIGLELYDYQFAVIPFYVPPGHGLFYALAVVTARQPVLQSHAKSIVRGVLVAGSAVAIAGLVLFGDTWGALWWVVAATLIARSSNGLLLAICCPYTMLLEWLGTWWGNWTWAPEVLGMRSGNPPSGVGILYVLLDLITVTIVGFLAGSREASFAEPTPEGDLELGETA